LPDADVAVELVTAFASGHAFTTEDSVASRAVEIAVTTNGRLALFACPAFVVVGGATTIGTAHTVPFGNRNIGTRRVVRSQQIGHDQEEVQQASLFQSLPNRLLSLAGAQHFILDVRMCHAVVRGGRIRIQRDHAIIVGTVGRQIVPVEMDLKRA
jgi:hypothetical protein